MSAIWVCRLFRVMYSHCKTFYCTHTFSRSFFRVSYFTALSAVKVEGGVYTHYSAYTYTALNFYVWTLYWRPTLEDLVVCVDLLPQLVEDGQLRQGDRPRLTHLHLQYQNKITGCCGTLLFYANLLNHAKTKRIFVYEHFYLAYCK